MKGRRTQDNEVKRRTEAAGCAGRGLGRPEETIRPHADVVHQRVPEEDDERLHGRERAHQRQWCDVTRDGDGREFRVVGCRRCDVLHVVRVRRVGHRVDAEEDGRGPHIHRQRLLASPQPAGRRELLRRELHAEALELRRDEQSDGRPSQSVHFLGRGAQKHQPCDVEEAKQLRDDLRDVFLHGTMHDCKSTRFGARQRIFQDQVPESGKHHLRSCANGQVSGIARRHHPHAHAARRRRCWHISFRARPGRRGAPLEECAPQRILRTREFNFGEDAHARVAVRHRDGGGATEFRDENRAPVPKRVGKHRRHVDPLLRGEGLEGSIAGAACKVSRKSRGAPHERNASRRRRRPAHDGRGERARRQEERRDGEKRKRPKPAHGHGRSSIRRRVCCLCNPPVHEHDALRLEKLVVQFIVHGDLTQRFGCVRGVKG